MSHTAPEHSGYRDPAQASEHVTDGSQCWCEPTIIKVAASKKYQGAQHHMEACRALLNVPDDEVLYVAIQQLREQLDLEKRQCAFESEHREKYREQLAAEQEHSVRLANDYVTTKEQLATAVEAIKVAKYRIINPTHTVGQSAYDVLAAALAKIGGKHE